MAITIALAGNPNCGKTTLFNALTGANQYVGNWPGVTVEKKEGRYKGNKDVVIQDLPGIYSLSPYTLEEVVSREYLVTERPDAILNIIDGTNIERNLYLTTQLLELGIPVVIAVNMIDLVRKNGDTIDVDALSKSIGCPVIEISALKGEGHNEAAELAIKAAEEHKLVNVDGNFADAIEETIAKIKADIKGIVPEELERWYAIKIFERDPKVMESISLGDKADEIEQITVACETAEDDDSESIITNERYSYIANVTADSVHKIRTKDNMTTSDKIDKVVTSRIFGLPIFVLIMFFVYAISMGDWKISIGKKMTDYANDVIFAEWVPKGVEALFGALGISDKSWIFGLVNDGIIAGVGAVLGFIPQMFVLFLFLSILEDIGYMSRVAFVMDRIFRHFGLSGKSFIPYMVATGCGVPGVMASRTIEQERDRKLTVMTATFMPCGAKLPMIGLIAGAIFNGSAYVAVSAYFIGIVSIILSAIILKKFKAFAGDAAPFVMELPAYHITSVKNILRTAFDRAFSFIKRAGSVILIASIILWFLTSYGFVNGKFGKVSTLFEDKDVATAEYQKELAQKRHISLDEVNPMDASLLASVGNTVSPIFRPLGFGSWKPTVATVTGLVAKEQVVGTFGVLYNYDDSKGALGDNGEQIWANVAKDYSGPAGMAFLIFNLLCAPCFAAIGAIKREMGNGKWTWAAIGWLTGWAYCLSLIAYNIGGVITGEFGFGVGPIVSLVLIAGIVYLLVRKGAEPEHSSKSVTAVEAAGAK